MTVIGLGLISGRRNALIAQEDAKDKFLGRLLAYIPGDIVAGYVAVVALIDTTDATFTAEWVVAYVFLALSLILLLGVFVGTYRKEHDNNWPPAKDYPWFRIVAGPVAFVAWVVALPQSPVFDWGNVPSWVQSLVLVGTTIVLTVAGGIWDKRKPAPSLEGAGDEAFADAAVEDQVDDEDREHGDDHAGEQGTPV